MNLINKEIIFIIVGVIIMSTIHNKIIMFINWNVKN